MTEKIGLHPVRGTFRRDTGVYDVLEKGRTRSRGSQHLSVVGRNLVLCDEASALCFRKLRERAANFFAPSGADVYWEQIGLREISVVVSFFLRAHGYRVAFSLVPEARFLWNAAAPLDYADVALDFIFESFLEVPERVEIFHFDFGAEWFGPAQADTHVRVAAQRTFFHIAIADAGVEQDLAE